MKLYDFAMAPNARRVRVFAAEKAISLEKVSVDLTKKEQLLEDYKAVNPRMAVPALELDDGTIITESMAICRYLEALHPTPPLFGTDAKGMAIVEMWQRRVEIEGLMAASDGARNSVEFFAGRALAGPVDFEQIPQLAERSLRRVDLFYDMLDARLAESEFIAGPDYSVADITALVACDFAKVLKKRVNPEHPNLLRWYQAVSARPSAKA